MDKLKFFIKWLLYCALTVLVFAFQSALGYRMPVFGTTPDFIPLLVAAAALFEGARGGAMFGFIAGFLCCSLGEAAVVYIPYYFFAGYFLGSLSTSSIHANLFTVLLFSLVIGVLSDLTKCIFYYFLSEQGVFNLIFNAIGARTVFTLAASPVLYPIIRFINKALSPHIYARHSRYTYTKPPQL